jgi:serine/threonine protein kinase
MRGLSHPNVMSIRQILQEDKGYETAHYLLLDLGVGLMELTRHKEVAPSFEQIRCIISQIVEGLDHIHSQGYMHRDVKPSNIYLMTDGTAKIGDFSISRKTASPSPTQEDEEKTGNVTTRFYRAP